MALKRCWRVRFETMPNYPSPLPSYQLENLLFTSLAPLHLPGHHLLPYFRNNFRQFVKKIVRNVFSAPYHNWTSGWPLFWRCWNYFGNNFFIIMLQTKNLCNIWNQSDIINPWHRAGEKLHVFFRGFNINFYNFYATPRKILKLGKVFVHNENFKFCTKFCFHYMIVFRR